MPSFYPRQHMPRQLLTPPEFVPSYHSACGGASYQQQNGYASQPAIRQDDGYDFADRYGQLAMAMPPMYPQAGTYLSNAPPSLPPASSFYDAAAATVLPPMRVPSGHSLAEAAMHQQRAQEYSQRMSQPAKEEKPVGGVSAKLDYDMDVMTDFVCETALRLITPGRMMPPSFRKWVHQVLCATRLPSATILLSMFYLSNRMPMLTSEPKTDTHLYRLLTIALVLGSKFLDDNTFINRSWSEVSGIRVDELNRLEMEWLNDIDYKLHRDPSESQGWTFWSDHWKEYQSHATVRTSRSSKLSPIDTSFNRRSFNPNKPLPPLPMQQAYSSLPYEYTPKSTQSSYNTPSYAQYDPWRSANDHSPASAPTTGPTTPEYYGTTGAWGPIEGYSRRTMFGFPPLSQPTAAQHSQQHATNYGLPAYTAQYNSSAWNQHGISCSCAYCVQRHPPYFMAPGYGPQAVAV
ncbi:hypothetical protein IAQ61_003000 [Plenodomus lingam]|uniref:Cyclin-like protein (Clg1) n=1 Tax=Leptosphaeria maculans (strain JN3 / isolate v23.1.3 / race Av1-4-5-6-7-8) TaxID=985895 RepID=E5A821_LEPMJ|nr:hypothetical protein LEMA_P073550.1 [Plenodomus lingam JN3]KAH9877632.1 hypothetical protein IAQ61_003000 [Plenodomus lingam]CBX99766.1 hypothetical protein LEMA_P073550.1 [Plenodomus lingam JN3]